MRKLRALIGLGILLPSMTASAQWMTWVDKNLLERIHITGNRTIGLHLHQVDGDRDTFDSLTYYGQGDKRITDSGSVRISGKQVLGAIDFDLTLSDNRFNDPQGRKLTLNYHKGPVRLLAGDIEGSLLNTNQFASIGRSMKGASIEYRAGGFALKALRTDAKGSARTVSIPGSNSPGPYYLQSSQIISDSQQVEVDGRPMTLGKDYVIDFELGSITFIGRSIAPTSTIVVSYETLGFNSSVGSIQGVSASQRLGKIGDLGVTYVEQRARGGGSLSQRVERFQGFGAPSTPYFLEFEPLLTRPISVRVDGLLQAIDVDYYFDATNPAIFYFRRFVPSTSTVEVLYTPKPVGTVDGNRKVVGFDYRLPLGGRNYLKYSQAFGSLQSDANPFSGTARGIQGFYESGKFQIRGGWRDIPSTFVSVESRGFSRNEKAFDLAAEYSMGRTDLELSHRNAAISVRRLTDDGNIEFSPARTTTTTFSARSGEGSPMSWNLEASRGTASTISGKSRLDSVSLSASKTLSRIETRLGVDYQTGNASSLQGGTLLERDLNLHSLHLDLGYRANRALTLNSRLALSQVKLGGTNGSGRDISLTASYRPTNRLSIDAGYIDSDSGAVASLQGFQSGYGLGYDGNGFSSGASAYSGSLGSAVRSIHANAQYRVSPTLGFNFHASRSKSTGSLNANTDSTAVGVGMDWQFGNHGLGLSIDHSSTQFIDSPLSSSALSINADISGQIVRHWKYSLYSSYLINGGTSLYRQNSLNFAGSLTYGLSRSQNLSLRFEQGTASGYLPQSESMIGLFYEHQLYRNVSLIGSYKIRKLANLDPANPGGAYKARGFDLELSFNFGT